MATHGQVPAHQNSTRMTIDFPILKHKQLKATAALLGIPMKEFILSCVLEKLDDKEILKSFEEDRDAEAFDRGMKSIGKDGYDSLADVKRHLGLNS